MKRSANISIDNETPQRRRRDHRQQQEGVEMEEEVMVDDPEIIPQQQQQALITPGTTRSSRSSNNNNNPQLDRVRRNLFHSTTTTTTVAITPSRPTTKTTITPSPSAKRKLIFGRSVVEVEVSDNVKQIYSIVKKLTGSIGGNGSFGPIYGELTMGSMQKMINLMKEYTNFDASSRFIDVGSGIGKPNLHVTQDPGVAVSYGIEVEVDRWLLGMNCLKGVLDLVAANNNEDDNPLSTESIVIEEQRESSLLAQCNCIFVHGDITGATIFDPFTHVYMFSIGFPPKLWIELAKMWNRSSSALYLICYHSPKYIIQKYKFNVELLIQTSTSMHGSKEGHMGYIYRRLNADTTCEEPMMSIDPYFAPAIDVLDGGIDSIRQHVNTKVNERMESVTRRTRSQRI